MPYQPYLAEISIFAGNFAPVGYAFCSGQLISISQNTALFSLLGTTYGGNGVTNFALPDLRGRVVIGAGQGSGLSNFDLGQVGGEEDHTLTVQEIPAHSHAVMAQSGEGNANAPAGNVLAGAVEPVSGYSSAAPNSAMSANTISAAGGSQPHNNLPPYLAINYIIALTGIFPSRS